MKIIQQANALSRRFSMNHQHQREYFRLPRKKSSDKDETQGTVRRMSVVVAERTIREMDSRNS